METAFFSPASIFHGDDSDDGRDEMQVDAEGEKKALEYAERVHKFPGMACYFANLLPVETASTGVVYNGNTRSGILVSEIVDYPVKALVFTANNINTLVNVVSEVSFILHDNSTAYSLLISDNGTKVFLFPQVKKIWLLAALFLPGSAVATLFITPSLTSTQFLRQKFPTGWLKSRSKMAPLKN